MVIYLSIGVVVSLLFFKITTQSFVPELNTENLILATIYWWIWPLVAYIVIIVGPVYLIRRFNARFR